MSKPATWLKWRLWHRFFLLNFVNFFKNNFFTEHFWATCAVCWNILLVFSQSHLILRFGHCVKSVGIWSFSGLYFPASVLNTVRMQENTSQRNSEYGHFTQWHYHRQYHSNSTKLDWCLLPILMHNGGVIRTLQNIYSRGFFRKWLSAFNR